MGRTAMTKPGQSKQASNQKFHPRQDTPVVVYLWIVGLGLLGYLVVGEIFLGSRPHPFHWIAGFLGGISGYFVGWIWYRWRGDVI